MIVTTKQMPKLLNKVLDSKLVPMMHGSPGTAKSSITKQVAAKRNLKVIDLRLAQSDPTDLNGFPAFNKDNTKAGYIPFNTFPIEGDELPKKVSIGDNIGVDAKGNPIQATKDEYYDGWLLFLDEFPSATLAVQAAAYKLVLDKQVGPFDLHSKVSIVAAGNKMSDRAVTNRLSTAMQSRLVHFEVELNSEDWLDWANNSNIDHRVKSFIGFRPEKLYRFDPDHDDYTFPCARTWEFVSDLIKNDQNIDPDHLPLLAGTIGEGAANQFLAYCEVYGDLISFADIVADPMGSEVPYEPSVLYALTGMIGEYTNTTNIDTVMKFINRLPLEFQVLTMRNILPKDPGITTTPAWQGWISLNAQEFMT